MKREKQVGVVLEIGLRFGALSPPVSDQMAEQGHHLPTEIVDAIQKDVDAITRLYLRGHLTGAEVRKARRRVIDQIAGELGKALASEVQL